MGLRLTILATLLMSGCPAVHRVDGSSDAGMGADGGTAPTDAATWRADVPADAPRVDVPADALERDASADAPRVPTDATDFDVPVASVESTRVRCVDTGEWCDRPSVCCQSALGGPRCPATEAECAGSAGRCDGPEDCSAGERCLVSYMPIPGWGAIYTGTRCVGGGIPLSPNDAYLCHADADCPAGDRCCELSPDTPPRCGLC